jgi:hypothetical protein
MVAEAQTGREAPELRAELERLERLAGWLDARYRIPGTPIRFGFDSVVGLIPGLGDGLAMLPAAYLVYRAHRLGLPAGALLGMGANVALDAAVGSVPILGDIFDLAFKANRRNVRVLRRHLERRTTRASPEDHAPRRAAGAARRAR